MNIVKNTSNVKDTSDDNPTFTIRPSTRIMRKKVNKGSKQHTCNGCGRSFVHTSNYTSHTLLCDQLCNTNKIKKMLTDEEGYIPSQTEMFYLVRNLMNKCEMLECEVQKLRKYAEITKKQIDAVQWLNNNVSLTTSYSSWLADITISQKELQTIFNCKYIDGVYQVLESRLPLFNTQSHPIKCFSQKKNVFYVYEDDEWKYMTKDDFNKMVNILSSRVIKAFYIWKQENIERIENDDYMYDTYTSNMRIVLGENKTNEQIILSLKNKLYAYLKCDLKNIVKYEFTF